MGSIINVDLLRYAWNSSYSVRCLHRLWFDWLIAGGPVILIHVSNPSKHLRLQLDEDISSSVKFFGWIHVVISRKFRLDNVNVLLQNLVSLIRNYS